MDRRDPQNMGWRSAELLYAVPTEERVMVFVPSEGQYFSLPFPSPLIQPHP